MPKIPTRHKQKILDELSKGIARSKKIYALLPKRSVKRHLMKVGIESMKEYQRKLVKKYGGKK